MLRREIYITAALTGAATHVILRAFEVPEITSALIAVTAAFTLRGGALLFGWTLPAYLELLRCYRHSLECGVPHLPLLVLPRRGSGDNHRLHWLQRPFASTCPSMRHTCA